MALFDRPEVSVGLISIDTDVLVKDTTYKNNITGQTFPGRPTEQIGDMSLVPNIFVVYPASDRFSVGAGIYSNFGTKTEFSDNFIANEYGGLTDLKTVNFGVSGSYRLTDTLSFGAGIDLITGTGKIQRSLNLLPNVPATKVPLADIDAEGTGIGWNAGLVYEMNDNHRFGLSYRYSPDIEASGKIKYINTGTLQLQDLPGKLLMKLPDIAEFSGYHRFHDKFALHYSVQYIGWSTFDKLATTEGAEIKDYQWQDGWHYAIGGTYFWNDQFTLRGGMMYDTSAQADLTSISVPDSDRQWLSAGLTYHWSKNADIDLGFTYLMGDAVKASESIGLSEVSATTQANAYLFGLQYTYRF